jgi:hypothetical protein
MSFSDVPSRINGTRVTYDWWDDLRSAGILLEAGETNVTAWVKYTVAFGALSTAALTNEITLFSLLSKQMCNGFIVKHSQAFTGGAISALSIEIGITGENNRYVKSFDIFQAIGDSVFAAETYDLDVRSFANPTNILLKATAVGANLSALTQGSVDIWVRKSRLS